MIYYTHKPDQSILTTDMIGFLPPLLSATDPVVYWGLVSPTPTGSIHRFEQIGMKIMLDTPDYSSPIQLSISAEQQILQTLGHRLFRRMIRVSRRSRKTIGDKSFAMDLGYLELDGIVDYIAANHSTWNTTTWAVGKTHPRHGIVFGDWLNFICELKGGKPIWDMTTTDFEVVSDCIGPFSSIQVKNQNWADVWQDHWRVFLLTSDKLYGRKIASISVLSSEIEEIILDEAITDSVGIIEITKCGRAVLSRISDFNCNFHTDSIYEAAITLDEVDSSIYEEMT